MTRRTRLLAAMLVAATSAACASAPNPWAVHERTADYKALTSNLDRMCPVVVQNGTGQMLETVMDMGGKDRSLGVLAAGESVTVGVACSARRVQAQGVSRDLDDRENQLFRASAVLDVVKETRLQFTPRDMVRW